MNGISSSSTTRLAAHRPAHDCAPVVLAQLAQASATVRTLTEEGDALDSSGDKDAAANKYRQGLTMCREAETLVGAAAGAWRTQERTLLDRVEGLRPAHRLASTPPAMPRPAGPTAPVQGEPNSAFNYRDADFRHGIAYASGLIRSAAALQDSDLGTAQARTEEAAQLLTWWARCRFQALGEEAREALREAGEKYARAARVRA